MILKFPFETKVPLFCLNAGAGEFERCYNSNVAPVGVEFFGRWVGAVIILLGVRIEPVARRLACKDIWWAVSS